MGLAHERPAVGREAPEDRREAAEVRGRGRVRVDLDAVRGGREQARPATFVGAPREPWCLDADAVASGLGDPSRMLVDAKRGAPNPLVPDTQESPEPKDDK